MPTSKVLVEILPVDIILLPFVSSSYQRFPSASGFVLMQNTSMSKLKCILGEGEKPENCKHIHKVNKGKYEKKKVGY